MNSGKGFSILCVVCLFFVLFYLKVFVVYLFENEIYAYNAFLQPFIESVFYLATFSSHVRVKHISCFIPCQVKITAIDIRLTNGITAPEFVFSLFPVSFVGSDIFL